MIMDYPESRRLRVLASQWRSEGRDGKAAEELEAALDELGVRADGPHLLGARVSGDSVPALKAAALTRAQDFYGDDAQLAIEHVSSVDAMSSGRFQATVRVRCLNFPEVTA